MLLAFAGLGQSAQEPLEQRGADLKKLADAWEPLYGTLNPVQKKRVSFLALVALRDVSDVREQRRTRLEDSDQD